MSSPLSAKAGPIVKFFWIVVVGYALDLGSYVAMVELGAHLYVAYVASFVIGSVCNVLLLRRFFAAGRHLFARDVALTLASNGVVMLLAMGIYVALMQFAGVHHVIAKVLSNGFSFLVNYYVRRRYF
jgi:hypothetical protein